MTEKRKPERCGNCLYHVYDELEDGCICVNRESDMWLSYTTNEDGCEKWEKKPYAGEI